MDLMDVNLSKCAQAKIAALSRRHRRSLVQVLRSVDAKLLAKIQRAPKEGRLNLIYHLHKDLLIFSELKDAIFLALDVFSLSDAQFNTLKSEIRNFRRTVGRKVRSALRKFSCLITNFYPDSCENKLSSLALRVDEKILMRRTQELQI